jgi:benzodiazapine receptor
MPPVLPGNPPRHTTTRVALAATGAAVTVALLGSAGTEIGAWYQSLRQPWWKPADLWFGPAWTLIFGLTAWSGTRTWLRAGSTARRKRLIQAFGLNGALNILWSWMFFRWRSPEWALAEVVLLWLSIAWLIALAWRIDRTAAILLSPYLVWVTFAAMLNAAVVQLNPSP